jgi:hypothetical protein
VIVKEQMRIEFFFVRKIRRQTRRYPDRLRSMTSLYDDTPNGPGCKMYMRSRARDETVVNPWRKPVH